MAKKSLFTTGYSGHSADSFVKLLRTHDISLVIDVRRNPISRKRGFSRTALATLLEENGLQYQHVRDLGVPVDLRHALRDGTCNLKVYLRRFRKYLREQTHLLDQVYALATKERCCLVCVEECSDECHRSVVAEEVAARNGHRVRIEHV